MLHLFQGMAQTELTKTLIAAGAQAVIMGLPPELTAEALETAAAAIRERGNDLGWCQKRAAHLARVAAPIDERRAND